MGLIRQDSGIFKKNLKLLVFATVIMLLFTILYPGLSPAAPVSDTGNGWQATLDRDDRILTYSFDHAGGYSLAIEGSAEHTTSLDTQFDAIIPDWENILKAALDAWGVTANITLTEVPDNGLDCGAAGAEGIIRISAHSMDALAHGFMPMETGFTEEDKGYSFYGDVHFSTDWTWDEDLFSTVAVHELGHSLGLNHNLDPYSIMHPFASAIKAAGVTAHDESDIRALYFPMNKPAEVYAGSIVANHRDWLAIMDGSEENRKALTISGHIDTDAEQKTAIKGQGVSLSIENYAFDWANLTILDKGRITTQGDNAYGMAVGDHNTIIMDGTIETFGFSSDAIAVMGSSNMISTGSSSIITTHGNGASGLYMGGDWGGERNYALLGGQILTTGDGGAGVFITAGNAELNLNGSITTQGDCGIGIFSYINNAFIDISARGSILTSGVDAVGAYGLGINSTIINTGRITTFGERGHAMEIRGGNNILIHGGIIETKGFKALGIWARDSNNIVDLSGDINAFQAESIRIGNGWGVDNNFTQTTSSGNYLLIHGSPEISGDMINGGADDGVRLYFGAYFDYEVRSFYTDPGTDFVYGGDIDGRTWIGEVSAGKTRLNGDIANFSIMTISPGATLGGSTHYTGDMVNNGILAPGNSIGTITVAGAYTQTGNLVMEIDNKGSDLLAVSGAVALEPEASLTITPIAPVVSQQFSFLTAGAGITGTLSQSTGDTLFLDFTLNTLGTGMTLDVVRSSSYEAFAIDNNQASLAAALDNLIPTASGNLATAMATIDMMTSPTDIEQAYSTLTPEEYGALTEVSFALTRNYTNFIDQSLAEGRSHGESGWRTHGRMLHLSGRRDNSSSFTGFDWGSNGLGMGIDYRFPQVILGLGTTILDTNVNNDTHEFTADTNSFITSVYTSVFRPSWHINAQAGYGYQESDTLRTVLMNGFAYSLDASVSSNMFFASLEGGIDHALSQTTTISPFTSLDYLLDRRTDFNEGDTTLGFHMDSQTAKSARFTLGTRISTVWQLGKQAKVFPTLKLGWAHELGETQYDLSGALGNEQIYTQGYDMKKNRALAGLDLLFKANTNTNFKLNFDGEWDGEDGTYGLQASFIRRF
ncbi:MAG: autotransporter domain-containing protein [Bacteroidetes bacterium]|nr:autotransporter domain-containing protein [Bacteroidota bacterium]